MTKTKYYLKTRHGIVLGVVKVNEESNVLYWNEIVRLLNQLYEENEWLKERLGVLENFLEGVKITSDLDEYLNVSLLQLLTEDDTYFLEYLQKKMGCDKDE